MFGCSATELREGAVGALQSPTGCGVRAGRRKTTTQQQEAWELGGQRFPPASAQAAERLLEFGSTSLCWFLFFSLFFLSNDLGESELGWELSHSEWERGGSCTNLGLSGRLRKQKTTFMFHHSPNYNRVKFGTSAVKTSFQSLLRLEAPSKSHGKEDS